MPTTSIAKGEIDPTKHQYILSKKEYCIPGGVDGDDIICYRAVIKSETTEKNQYTGPIYLRESTLQKWPVEEIIKACCFFLEPNEVLYFPNIQQKKKLSAQFDQILNSLSFPQRQNIVRFLVRYPRVCPLFEEMFNPNNIIISNKEKDIKESLGNLAENVSFLFDSNFYINNDETGRKLLDLLMKEKIPGDTAAEKNLYFLAVEKRRIF